MRPIDLSIIITVFNTELYIERCFESIIKHSSEDDISIEVIFVDDGSKDRSLDILLKLQEQYPFVQVATLDNRGPSAARNTGMDLASGEYFLFIDSDDWIDFEIIRKLLFIAKENRIDLLSYRLRFFYEGGASKTMAPFQVPYEIVLTGQNALLHGYQPSSACLFLYRTKHVKNKGLKFHPGIYQEDVEFTFRLFLNSERVYFSKEVAYTYYRHAESMTMTHEVSTKQKYLKDAIKVAALMKNSIQVYQPLDQPVINAIQKNYNSVVWNLLWRFLMSPRELGFQFKKECIKDLKAANLYPIRGALKTSFQNKMRYFFNFLGLYNLSLRLTSMAFYRNNASKS